MNQLESALQGKITPEMKHVAEQEGVAPEFVRQGVAEGKIVIPCNKQRLNIVPIGIGTGLRTKVSARSLPENPD